MSWVRGNGAGHGRPRPKNANAVRKSLRKVVPWPPLDPKALDRDAVGAKSETKVEEGWLGTTECAFGFY